MAKGVTKARTIVIGTRGSKLAVRQTGIIVAALEKADPDLRTAVRQVRTEGDRRPTVSLAEIGGQGVFVKELEAALTRRDIDLAVHSLKDVPADVAPGLTLAAFPERADPRDALVTRGGATLASLPAGARIGTGSQRRAVQLRALRSDIEPVDIRGNVDTRVRKVDDGTVDAAVLAVAGLRRLGMLDRAEHVFSNEDMIPAVGQGTLAIEARSDDSELLELLAAVDHEHTRLASLAERAFMRTLGGGCRLPFGALASVVADTVQVFGFISDEQGAEFYRGATTAPLSAPETAGRRLAEDLLAQGAAPLVQAAQAP